MINGGRNRKRPYEVERSGFTEELTFPVIPRNRLTNEPIILEGMIEGHHVRRIHIDKGRSSEIMFLKRSIPFLGFGRPSDDHVRGRKKQNSANGIHNRRDNQKGSAPRMGHQCNTNQASKRCLAGVDGLLKPQQNLCQGYVPFSGDRRRTSIIDGIPIQMFPMAPQGK
ncbi:hypothetical protein Tco_0946544 [Tanacetum coccineum]